MLSQRVLVAEDDPAFRRVITFSLEKAGFHVEAVGDGKTAGQMLSAGPFGLLVTDHQMPLCCGIELIESLRQSPALNGLPVILCTGRGLELDTQDLTERLKVAEIMQKPFSPRFLAERAAQILSGRPVRSPRMVERRRGCATC